MEIANPALTTKNPLYPYYAGYSVMFVKSIIEGLELNSKDVILDPWNGSGTTTAVAAEHGIQSIGVDINPATVVYAKSRLVDKGNVKEINKKCEEIISIAQSMQKPVTDDDLLACWFPKESVVVLRHIIYAINEVYLIDSLEELCCQNGVRVREAAFFYVAMFSVVKHLLRTLQSKNPTWTKDGVVNPIGVKEVTDVFLKQVKRNCKYLENGLESVVAKVATRMFWASSRDLPLDDAAVSCVITSPPYCTRIDYAVSMKVELAVIGLPPSRFRKLRDETMGTSTIHRHRASFDILDEWGGIAKQLLNSIRNHGSYASESYYYKTYWQYIDDSYHSLKELTRVTKKNSPVILVVQDSYYKDIHVNLAEIYKEIGSMLGWRLSAVRKASGSSRGHRLLADGTPRLEYAFLPRGFTPFH